MVLHILLSILAATQTPKLTVQSGPGNLVTELAMSSDGKWVAVVGDTTEVRLFNAETGLMVQRTVAGGTTLQEAAFSPDSKKLYAMGTYDGIAEIDLSLGSVARRVNFMSYHGMALSKDGARLFAGSFAKLHIINTKTMTEERVLAGAEGTSIDVIRVSPDGRTFFLGRKKNSGSSTVEVYDAVSLGLLATLPIAATEGSHYSGDSALIVAASTDACVAYDGKSGQQVWTHPAHRPRITPEPMGSGVICSDWDGVRLLNVKTGQVQQSFPLDVGHGAASAQTARRFAVAKQKGFLRVFDLQSNKQTDVVARGLMHETVSASPDGKWFVAPFEDGTVRLFESKSARMKASMRIGQAKQTRRLAAFTPDSATVVGCEDGWLHRFDTKSSRLLSRTNIKSCPYPFGVSNSQFVGVFMVNGDYRNKRVAAINLTSGAEVWGMPLPEGMDQLTVDPTGKYVALHSVKWLLLNAQNGQTIGTADAKSEPGPSDIAFSPDGKRVVLVDPAGYDNTGVSIYSVPDLKLEKRCERKATSSLVSLAFATPTTVVTGHWKPKFEVNVWNLTDCAVTQSFTAQSSEIGGVGLVNGGKHILSVGGRSGVMRLHETSTATHLVDVIALAQDGFVSATPDGFYAANQSSTEAVRFSLGTESIRFDLFELRLHRPDVLLQRLAVADPKEVALYRRAYEKRLERLGYSLAALSGDFHAPVVTASAGPAVGDSLPLNITATDSKSAIGRLVIEVNRVPVDGAGGTPWNVPLGKSSSKQVSIRLTPGNNTIDVSVLNTAGTESERVTIVRTGPPAAKPARTFVRAIGVSQYAQSTYNLDYAAKDALDMAAVLQHAQGASSTSDVVILADGQVTRDAVRALKTGLMASEPQDTVILFVAGHGVLDDKLDYYYATADLDFASPAQRGVPFSDIEDLLSGIPARRKLLLIDTCHSGEVDKDEFGSKQVAMSNEGSIKRRGFKRIKRSDTADEVKLAAQLQRELFVDLRRGSGASVLTSASGAEYALESATWKNGVFTHALLKAVKERAADANRDQQIGLQELNQFVIQRVLELTQGQQTPTARALNEASQVVFK